jgi:hypothetical protein
MEIEQSMQEVSEKIQDFDIEAMVERLEDIHVLELMEMLIRKLI